MEYNGVIQVIKSYRICGVNVSVEAEHFPEGNPDWLAFEAPESKNALQIICKISDSLEKNENQLIGKTSTSAVYSDGDSIIREIPMGTVDGVMTIYSPESNVSTSYFTHESFDTMMDRRYMWSSVSLAQLFLYRKIIFLHSSYIDVGGKAILFTAPCQTGKSTQAALWQKHRGAEIINGDKSGISVSDGKVFAHGVPFCGTSGICKNRSLALAAIVSLSQAKENSVRRLGGIDSLQAIMNNTYLDFIAPDEQRTFVDCVIEILGHVPVYSLSCTPDEDAVAVLETALKKEGVI